MSDNIKEEIITQLTANPHIRIVKRQDVVKINYLTCPFCGKEKHFSLFLPKTITADINSAINYISDGGDFGYVCYRCKEFKFPDKSNTDTSSVIKVLKEVLNSSFFKENPESGNYSRKFTIFALWELYLRKFNLWKENTNITMFAYLKQRKINYDLIEKTTNIKFYSFLTYKDKRWIRILNKYKKKIDKLIPLYKYQSFVAISGGYPDSGIILRNLKPDTHFRYYTAFDMPIIMKTNSFKTPQTVIMTEGVMDILTLYGLLYSLSDLDINNTLFVASNGVRFYSALNWVKKLYGNWNNLYIFGDNDFWTKESLKYPHQLLFYTYFVNDLRYKDINELVQKEDIKIDSFSQFLNTYIVSFNQRKNKQILSNLKNIIGG